jgi:hypothetical protein
MRYLLTVLLMLPSSAVLAQQPDAALKKYTIPLHGTWCLQMQVPENWNAKMKPREHLSREVIFSHGQDMFSASFLICWPGEGCYDRSYNKKQRIMYHTNIDGMNILHEMKEETIDLHEIDCPESHGAWLRLTKKKPDPYPYLTMGGLGTGHFIIKFSLLSKDRDKVYQKQLLDVLRTIHAVKN